jgi:hypothetical protein
MRESLLSNNSQEEIVANGRRDKFAKSKAIMSDEDSDAMDDIGNEGI